MHKPFRALKEIYNPYAPYMPYKDRYDIQQRPDVNSTIGPVPRDESTLEAEKGEVALKPDLSGAYHISGKKHSQGGTPLNLDPGSFIFSNDKDLHFTPQEKQVFEFKKGGQVGKIANTPARILKREIPLAHYNRSADIASDPRHEYDDIAKKSAGLMLDKYRQKMGQVAYVQESKKGFPTGVPDFAKGTAPVYDDQTEDKITQNQQYMKAGGYTPWMNPYSDKMMTFQLGGPYDRMGGQTYADGGDTGGSGLPPGYPINPSDAYPGGNTPSGKITPKGLANNFNYPDGVNQLVKDWRNAGVDLGPLNTRDAQDAMYQWALKNNPAMVRDMWKQYGNTAQGKEFGMNYDVNNLDDIQLRKMGDAYDDGMLGARVFSPQRQRSNVTVNPYNPTTPQIAAGPPGQQGPLPVPDYTPPDALNPNPYQPGTTLPYNPRIPMSPMQKANLLYAGYQAMSVPRYNPYRSQMNSPTVELARTNDQPALTAIRSSAAQAYNANRAQNPYLSGTNNADIYGKSLEAQQGVIGQYANQNVGIANQQATLNNQIQRQDLGFNTQANQRYYDQTQQLAQNYNNEKRFATNQAVSLGNQYVSQNQALEQMLAQQRTYGRTQVGTNADGSPIYQAKPLYDVDVSGFSPHVYYTGAGSLNSLPYMTNRLNDLNATINALKGAGIDVNSSAAPRWFAAFKGQPLMNPYSYPQGANGYGESGQGYKKGGMYGWMSQLYNNPYAR